MPDLVGSEVAREKRAKRANEEESNLTRKIDERPFETCYKLVNKRRRKLDKKELNEIKEEVFGREIKNGES